MDKEGYSEYGYRGTHELQQAKDEIKRLEKIIKEIHMVGGNTPGSLGPAYSKPAKGGSNGKGIADGIHAKDAAKEAEKAAKKAAKSLKKFF